MTHGPVPEQAPDQPENSEPESATAVSVIAVPSSKAAVLGEMAVGGELDHVGAEREIADPVPGFTRHVRTGDSYPIRLIGADFAGRQHFAFGGQHAFDPARGDQRGVHFNRLATGDLKRDPLRTPTFRKS